MHSVSERTREILDCESVVWDITLSSQARSRYSSHATDTRLENTSPSTGGSEVPAYDRCYILATDIYVIVFRAVCIRIYYAVLIATPEAVLTLTGSRILTAVYIYILATQ